MAEDERETSLDMTLPLIRTPPRPRPALSAPPVAPAAEAEAYRRHRHAHVTRESALEESKYNARAIRKQGKRKGGKGLFQDTEGSISHHKAYGGKYLYVKVSKG